MQTIVELPEFLKRAERLLTPGEKVGVINYLASHPQSGELIQGTGGIRKQRDLLKERAKVAVSE